MDLGTGRFYLYREDGKKMIQVIHCKPCKTKYDLYGMKKSAYQHVRLKLETEDVLKFKADNNLYFEKELGSQITLDDLL